MQKRVWEFPKIKNQTLNGYPFDVLARNEK